jgi:serine/threonine-protein kinase mTOR
LHGLIKQYRETNSVPVAVEHNIMRSKYTKYEQLLLVDKLCIFEHALKQTEGMDLARMMFINAGNCDRSLKARLVYSRSLAMTSIVGYVLGLGDRHPSNLMIDRESGQVVHVDFGDCFDVTCFRDRYPEKIPFRLTRQLINALEVAGLEGTFRITCERVMDLIRNNRDTVMAMLEAFIYDPLVTWRLLPSGSGMDETHTSLSWQARAIIDRVNAKIVDGDSPIPVQVDRLIREATAHENLCSLYLGYCAFW